MVHRFGNNEERLKVRSGPQFMDPRIGWSKEMLSMVDVSNHNESGGDGFRR